MCSLHTETIYVRLWESDFLYRSEHKYENPSGYPTFWSHIIDAVDFKEDHLLLPKVTNAHVDTLLKNKTPIKRCICSNVINSHFNSHLV